MRRVNPGDKSEFEAAFERLSSSSRYTRFFAPLLELPEQMLEAAANPPAGQVVALVALASEKADADIVGGARYAHVPPAGEACEFAVTVADDWQGAGLARHLMQTLIALAQERGLRRMEGHVLAENTGMRGLASRLGFTDVASPEEHTLRLVTLDLV
ncbi:GNAT family N-acetyltransferase [uncultured Ramlibacter sp.]|uniref:GNAT family N-acetyltransferase n=1 Tax=uncultured Ramlibacter sp. TaxID=260755 RepID=UPI002625F811|nr:GNAT family N-acetyltransferase [uncultured Ramlibacter sp.]